MPELAEIHIASRFINHVAAGTFFRSPIVKSEVSKMKDVTWNSNRFTIQSSARGKELQMILTDLSDENGHLADKREDDVRKLTLTFGFGMSGKFSLDRFDKIPKHAHLQFFTTETPANVLSFVDFRRFGKWDARDFDPTRGPDPVLSPKEFRRNILTNLNKSLFQKAVCEVILDQRYFNGLGNYLRAEILFRAKIPPFTDARSLLMDLPIDHEIDSANPDLLDLCTLVPKEVFAFTKPTEGYNPDSELEIYVPFRNWLRCYMKPGMKNLVDRFSRTIWFSGPPGPMVPAIQVERHSGKRRKKQADPDQDDDQGEDAASPTKKKRRSKKPQKNEESVLAAASPTKKKRRPKKPQKNEEPVLAVSSDSLTVKDETSANEVDFEPRNTSSKGEKRGLKKEKSAPRPTGGRKVAVSGQDAVSAKSSAEFPDDPLNSRKSRKKKAVSDHENGAERRRSTRKKNIK